MVGHSMGAFVVTEALRDLALRGHTSSLKRLGGVVLAAPDIDVDVFLSQLDDIGDIPRPFTIIVSQRDRALRFSGDWRAATHVSATAPRSLSFRREIAVIDVSNIDGGRHNVFASSPTLMEIVNNDALMRSVVREDQGPVGQTMLANSASVVEGATSLGIFLPSRVLSGLAQASAEQSRRYGRASD
ncbi:esterase/lipase superfamily enzyme [Rhizobium sp. BK060]|nr:esterase/lipase superfamily enzyme [Rhizobium sp. BK060]